MARRKTPNDARESLRKRLRARFGLPRLLIVGFLGFFGAWLTFLLAVSGVTRQQAPQQALKFVPWDGVAIALEADIELFTGGKRPNFVAIEYAGRTALANEPINPRALRLLAIAAEQRRELARSAKLVAKSQAMSRRDAVTQIYLIEMAVQRDDVAAVLKHYDIALRTNGEVGAVLFPRLLVAIGSPRIRDALSAYIKADIPWTREFVEDSITRGTNLSSLVSLIVDNGGLGRAPRALQQQATLLEQLFKQQKYDDMQRLYRAGPDANPARLTSAALAPEDRRQMISAIGWEMITDAEAGGSISLDQASKRPTMAVYVNAGNLRYLARKLLYLPASDYRFQAQLGSITPGQGGSLTWQLRCLDPATPAPLSVSANVVRSVTKTVRIPQGCKVQLLELLASGGRGQTGLEAVVNDISLTPL